MSYSKLVWSGVKDLFSIFLHYLSILFTIVREEAAQIEGTREGVTKSFAFS
jgi:hypothetical protein